MATKKEPVQEPRDSVKSTRVDADVAAEIERLYEKADADEGHWIPVSERLPAGKDFMLVVYGRTAEHPGHVTYAWYPSAREGWIECFEGSRIPDVMFWRPCPLPPPLALGELR